MTETMTMALLRSSARKAFENVPSIHPAKLNQSRNWAERVLKYLLTHLHVVSLLNVYEQPDELIPKIC